jgi:NADH-quinone oxidoreductase subunit L
MTAPMVVLAIGSVGAGALLALGGRLQTWLEPVVGSHEAEHVVPPWVTTVLALAAVAVGVLIAYRRYTAGVPRTAPQDVSALTVAARRDLYGDAVNEAVFMRGGQQITRAMVAVDDTAIDGSVSGAMAGVRRIADALRGLQTGYARSYALSMLAGTGLFVGAVLIAAMWR